ncbi:MULTISPECIES: glycosyltransferase family 2 protein [unclassified Leisingera]|uniref:glycosyltransferase family 2 protein n=1 Tax=unclassified Leisingera TaxID=2614906 RepID=UPI0002D3AC4C|nr:MULTISPECIES: glycosyltransferase family 2 protein [unclassified Leisingera]KIC24182.1 glycosyl transferase [Leisingera sp. ANG-S3]KIC52898.1 glycosyl transferase [Leisingera sp. ANG-S]KID07298.1 glycosyl transferase [Leisingera sp. ANG1]
MDQPLNSRISIITVTYNSSVIVENLLRSIPSGIPVVLVDNASRDAEATRILATDHGARFIANSENAGFGRACNQGAELADTEFLFFVNPDAELFPDTLEHLLASADAHPEASAFNTRIVKGDGSLFFKRRSKLIAKSLWLSRDAAKQDGEVPVLSGGALLVRKAAFNKVGGFDPKIFLFHEDDDLSLRLKAECGPLRYVYGAQVRHLLGHSTERSARTAALKAWYMGQSRVYAARKHGQPFGFLRALGEAVLQLISPVNLLSARKRAKAWYYFRAILSSPGREKADQLPPWA